VEPEAEYGETRWREELDDELRNAGESMGPKTAMRRLLSARSTYFYVFKSKGFVILAYKGQSVVLDNRFWDHLRQIFNRNADCEQYAHHRIRKILDELYADEMSVVNKVHNA
jgi:hypothetical protein